MRRFLEAEAPAGSTVSFFDFSYNHVLKRYVDLAHLPLMDLRHYGEWSLLQDYHAVATIRHPYSRLASACREYYKQKCRETEIQMRTRPPSREQVISYLQALPSAYESHDLRYVHAFPITWFTHYGSTPVVDTLLSCDNFSADLVKLRQCSSIPDEVIEKLDELLAMSFATGSPSLMDLEADPDLQAMANLLHYEDFNTFGFTRADSKATDPCLREIIDHAYSTTHSHDIRYLGLAPKVRWYWGRDSNKIPPVMPMVRNRN
jgi:hypothetical protein